jgi:hypothetical protein
VRRERVDGVVIARDGQDPTIDRKGAAIIAAGGMAGLVDTDDTPTTLSGAFGGWQADLTDYGLDADSNVRLGYALSAAEDTVIDDFLYRAEVPGRPEANEMRADITFKQRPDGTTTGLVFDDPTAADSDHFRVTRDAANDELTFESDSGQGRFLFDGFETEVEIRGDTRLADDASDVGGNLSVEGDTTLGEDGADTLIANATATFTSDLTVGDDAADRLNVQSISDFDNIASFNEDVNIGLDGADQLTVESTSTFNGETTINNALTVDAGSSDVTVDANLISLTGQTEIDGNIDVVVDCVNENLNVGLGPNIAGARTDACLRVGGSADVEGEIYGTGFFYDSDRRLKYDIEDVENALERIDALRAVNYKWRRDGGQDLGLIAQEVREVFPELVAADQNGMLSVKYGNLVAPLIAAVQQLKQQNEELKARVDAATTRSAYPSMEGPGSARR